MVRAAPRVLVVDDEAPICEVLEFAFGDEGWDVQARTCYQDALELSQRWVADVILLDLRMPDMNAESFLAAYRQQVKADIPVILLSAASDLDQHVTRLAANGRVAKPFDIDDLCAIVRKLILQDETGGTICGASIGC